jgi:hypothetical protein
VAGNDRRQGQPRRYDGDQLSTDQISWAVRKRQRVTAHLPGQTVEGYIFGADRFHWSLVTADVEVYLIPKQTPLRLVEEDALRSEPRAADLAPFTDPYRRRVLADRFKIVEPPAEGTEGEDPLIH